MDSVVITLQHEEDGQDINVDLAMPVSTPLFILAPILVRELALSGFNLNKSKENSLYIGRVISSGIVIRPSETLAQAGVVDGDILELTAVSEVQNVIGPDPDIRGTYLQSVETRQVFHCRKNHNLIGRTRDCTINLSQLPNSNYISKVHANILRRSDGYWIKDERSLNGTYVDGYSVPPGDRVRIRSGQHIKLGQDGPVLIFFSTR